ncbi:MAG: PKD domain-containing protein, partial [Geodermatophilaceae bacterium]
MSRRIALPWASHVGGRTSGLAIAGLLLIGLLPTTPAAAVQSAHNQVVNAVPSTLTPDIRDGRVLTIVKVGNKVIVGGTFTQVANRNGGTAYTRNNIFAFDATTGNVDTAFAPTVNGVVNTLLPGSGVNTVYAGGTFTTVNGATHRNLTLLNTGNGALVAGFRAASLNGAVNDLALSAGRLHVGGVFTTAAGIGHGGLVTLSPTTGAVDPYMAVDVSVNHNYNGVSGARAAVGVSKLDISPDGARLVAIGNFKIAEGQMRDQAVVILLQGGGPVVDPNWRTTRYEPACFANAFDSYVRDIDFSPDGAWFSIVATGGPNPGTLCDTATRFETSDTGQDVQPRWIADSGGDTLFSVAITGTALYTGGHQRWMNNAGGRDAAAPGAVPRPGLAALDPLNGVPLSWNPGRQPRGVGAQALLATTNGLYVGSDTEYIGNVRYFRPRIAFFPLAGGTPPASQNTGSLPSNVFLAGPGLIAANNVAKRFFDGTTASSTSTLPNPDGIEWSRARGAFMAGGKVIYGWSDGNLYTRTFDGTSFGPAVLVDPYNDPFWSNVQTGSGQTYRGVKPNFYTEQLANVTGMFYSAGRVYYTRAGQQGLFARGMSLDSLIVAPTDSTVSVSPSWADVQGMFVSGGSMYWGSAADGNLRRIAFTNGVPTGSATVVSGPLLDGNDWRTRAMFLGPGAPPPPNQLPNASFTSSCTGLTCSFNAGASTDGDGSIVSYSWTFGDNTTGSGVTTSHTYTTAGTKTVTLTVTDNAGGTDSATAQVVAGQTNAAPQASFTVSCNARACSFNGTASSDSDGTVVGYAWNFGDNATATGATTTHTYAAAGTYSVTLVVTDDDGATGTRTQQQTVTQSQTIAFRASATPFDGNGVTSASVTIPSSVQPGDGLV